MEMIGASLMADLWLVAVDGRMGHCIIDFHWIFDLLLVAKFEGIVVKSEIGNRFWNWGMFMVDDFQNWV
jgi:hypothetical protein